MKKPSRTVFAAAGIGLVAIVVTAVLLFGRSASSPAPPIASLADFAAYTHRCDGDLFYGKSETPTAGLDTPLYTYGCLIKTTDGITILNSQLIIFSATLSQPFAEVKEQLVPGEFPQSVESRQLNGYTILEAQTETQRTIVLCGTCQAGEPIFIIITEFLQISDQNILDILEGNELPIDPAFETICADLERCAFLIPQDSEDAGRAKQWTLTTEGTIANVYFSAQQEFLEETDTIFGYFFDRSTLLPPTTSITRDEAGVLCIETGEAEENHHCVIEDSDVIIFVRSSLPINPDTDPLVSDIRTLA